MKAQIGEAQLPQLPLDRVPEDVHQSLGPGELLCFTCCGLLQHHSASFSFRAFCDKTCVKAGSRLPQEEGLTLGERLGWALAVKYLLAWACRLARTGGELAGVSYRSRWVHLLKLWRKQRVFLCLESC